MTKKLTWGLFTILIILVFFQYRGQRRLSLAFDEMHNELIELQQASHQLHSRLKENKNLSDFYSTWNGLPNPLEGRQIAVKQKSANDLPPANNPPTAAALERQDANNDSVSALPSFTDYKSNLATALQNFDLTDRNHDNTLQVEELGTTSNSTKLYDLNHDGEVDKDELVAISNLLTRSTKYAEQHDKGKNGFPIEKEAFDGDWRQFQHFDVNQDNVISEEEHFNFLLTVRNERRRFDVNFDGDISFEEFGQSRLRFDFLDQDHDGLLDESEIGKGMVKGKW